jgi:hypothetical protein
MDMQQCKKKGFVKTVQIDNNQINSLLKSIKNKQEASDILPDKLIDSKVTLMYDSLRILLEVLTLKKYLKIYNHECYTAFLKKLLMSLHLETNLINLGK